MAQMTEAQFTETVRAAYGGDAEAFGRLYELLYRDMFHIARASLRSREDAADAVSEAVLDAYRSMEQLRDMAAFRAWMFKILAAKIKRIQRAYGNAPQPLDAVTPPAYEFGYAVPELRDALASLAQEERLLLSMQVLGGYQSRELARMFGSTDVAIRKRLTRIRAKLRAELTDAAFETGRNDDAIQSV